jgi:hypothetical protein
MSVKTSNKTEKEPPEKPLKQTGAAIHPKQILPMVNWYNPKQLIRTALQTTVSSLIGAHVDRRILDVSKKEQARYLDYSSAFKGKSVWIDYVADSGDGWNSTYSIAYQISQAALSVTSPSGQSFETFKGNFLIFGGDQVYPTPSRKDYEKRLVFPYESAFRFSNKPHPRLFALPGNHDWYDSLTSFSRLFISRKWFAGWKIPQKRSYFCIRLTNKWWLIGADIQLSSDIDDPQLTFFRKAASEMKENDEVILCVAEPHWIWAHLYGHKDDSCTESNLAMLEHVLQKKISIYVAGDLHHYRRHENENKIQKITAGGGGAFLHPTHRSPVQRMTSTSKDGKTSEYVEKSSFPSRRTSSFLSLRVLAMPIRDKGFLILVGLFYILAAQAVKNHHLSPTENIWTFAIRNFTHFLAPNWSTSLLLAVLIAFSFLSRSTYKQFQSTFVNFFAGTIHWLLHMFALSILFSLYCAFQQPLADALAFSSPACLLATDIIYNILFFLICAATGSWIFCCYLFLSLNLIGLHVNECFSAIGIADWKHFLRFHITPDGAITIYPIGIEKVSRKWSRPLDLESKIGPDFLPSDPKKKAKPFLIEEPIRLCRQSNT